MLVTVVIQKAFDSVNHQFLTLALKIGQNLQQMDKNSIK